MAIRKDIDNNFPIFIYGLVDPINKEIRYIGWCQDMKRRYSEHLSDAKTGDRNHRCNWIRKLFSNNLKPEMILIEKTIYSLRIEKEQYWIKYYGRENLTNATDGGEGNLGWIPSQEWRDNISKLLKGKSSWNKGVPMRDETKKKLSDARKGKNTGKDNPFFGKHHTEENKKILSERHKGKPSPNKGVPMTEENKKKLSIAKKEKMTDEKRKTFQMDKKEKFHQQKEQG